MNTTKLTCLGIDLSSKKDNTVACLLTVHEDGQIIVNSPVTKCTDEDLTNLIKGNYKNEKNKGEEFPKPQAIGIDAPFGWPVAFVESVQSWSHICWEGESNKTFRESLRLRETDRWIRYATNTTPLSVSSDKIASVAMRVMSLLNRFSVNDKSGMSAINHQYFFEVYPAASLAKWEFVTKHNENNDTYSYKNGPKAQIMRERMMKAICDLLPQLSVTQALFSTYTISDHAFDAFISALTTCAALNENTTPPEQACFESPQFRELRPESAKTEGWIHLPKGQLKELFSLEK